MSYSDIGKLIDRWLADTDFRAAVRKSPEDAVKKAGVNLSTDEWAAFRHVDWSLTDEQLRERASKLFG